MKKQDHERILKDTRDALQAELATLRATIDAREASHTLAAATGPQEQIAAIVARSQATKRLVDAITTQQAIARRITRRRDRQIARLRKRLTAGPPTPAEAYRQAEKRLRKAERWHASAYAYRDRAISAYHDARANLPNQNAATAARPAA